MTEKDLPIVPTTSVETAPTNSTPDLDDDIFSGGNDDDFFSDGNDDDFFSDGNGDDFFSDGNGDDIGNDYNIYSYYYYDIYSFS